MSGDRPRKQTAFRCDESALTEFQIRLKRERMEMSPVIEGWIQAYLDDKLGLPPDVNPPKTVVSTTPEIGAQKSDIRDLPESETVGIITIPHETIGTPITARGWQAEVLEKLDELRKKDFNYAQLAAALGAVLTARNIEKLSKEFDKLAETKGQGRPGVVGGRKRSRRATRTNKGAA